MQSKRPKTCSQTDLMHCYYMLMSPASYFSTFAPTICG